MVSHERNLSHLRYLNCDMIAHTRPLSQHPLSPTYSLNLQRKGEMRVKVLFVCSGNAHRSPLAEALLKGLRPEWKVDSAGLRVSIPISEEVKTYLGKEKAERYLKKVP